PEPSQLTQFSTGSNPLELFVTSDSIGQLDVFVNGIEAGHTRGMTESPAMYQSPPFAVTIPASAAKGPLVIAIRSWAGPKVTISRGLLAKVELGPQPEIDERVAAAKGAQWNEN